MTVNKDNLATNEYVSKIRQARPLSNDENIAKFKLMWASHDVSIRSELIDGNMHWVLRLVEEMCDRSQTDISFCEFIDVSRCWLEKAVDKYSNPIHAFAPDETLTNGYAIWWVKVGILKFADRRGYEYSSGSNEIVNATPEGPFDRIYKHFQEEEERKTDKTI